MCNTEMIDGAWAAQENLGLSSCQLNTMEHFQKARMSGVMIGEARLWGRPVRALKKKKEKTKAEGGVRTSRVSAGNSDAMR